VASHSNQNTYNCFETRKSSQVRSTLRMRFGFEMSYHTSTVHQRTVKPVSIGVPPPHERRPHPACTSNIRAYDILSRKSGAYPVALSALVGREDYFPRLPSKLQASRPHDEVFRCQRFVVNQASAPPRRQSPCKALSIRVSANEMVPLSALVEEPLVRVEPTVQTA